MKYFIKKVTYGTNQKTYWALFFKDSRSELFFVIHVTYGDAKWKLENCRRNNQTNRNYFNNWKTNVQAYGYRFVK